MHLDVRVMVGTGGRGRYRWDGHAWRKRSWEADHKEALEGVCRHAANCASDNIRLARELTTEARATHVLRIASEDARILIDADAFDANPLLINHRTSTTDLRTCASIPQLREHYTTKMTLADPTGDAPVFLDFLRYAMDGDEEMVKYLQRGVGYSLSGSIEEHAIFCLFGPGGTGKTAFLNAVSGALGDYAHQAPMDLFLSQTGERHPADLAALRGARMVVATETEEGKRFDEAKIKALSGGDPITARFMRGDFFTYRPTFKIWLAGNHRPGMRSADDAMRRRLHVIPFIRKPVTIDPNLPDKLRAEAGGILRWAVEGCREWRRIGLAPPRTVVAATDEYFEAENTLGHWLEERCIRGVERRTAVKALFADFVIWAKGAGEYAGSEKAFSQRLIAAGYQRYRSRAERGFVGIALCDRSNVGELTL